MVTFAGVYAVILASTYGTPKAASRAYWRTLDFIGWFAATLQLLAQVVSNVPAEAVPPEAEWFFDLVQLSLLDVSREVHPDCIEGGVSFTTAHLAAVVVIAFVVMVLVALQLRAVDRVVAAGTTATVPKSLLHGVRATKMLQGVLFMGYARTSAVAMAELRAQGDDTALSLAALVLVVLGLPLLSFWYIYLNIIANP